MSQRSNNQTETTMTTQPDPAAVRAHTEALYAGHSDDAKERVIARECAIPEGRALAEVAARFRDTRHLMSCPCTSCNLAKLARAYLDKLDKK